MSCDIFIPWLMPSNRKKTGFDIVFSMHAHDTPSGDTVPVLPVSLEATSENYNRDAASDEKGVTGTQCQFSLMLEKVTGSRHLHPIAIVVREDAKPLFIMPEVYYPLTERWKTTNKALEEASFSAYRWEDGHGLPLRIAALDEAKKRFGPPTCYRTIELKGYPLEFAYTFRQDLGLVVQQTLSLGLWRWPDGIGRHYGGETILAWELTKSQLATNVFEENAEFMQDLVTQFLLKNHRVVRTFSCGDAGFRIYGRDSDLCGIMLNTPRFTSEPARSEIDIYDSTGLFAVTGLMSPEVRVAAKGGNGKLGLVAAFELHPCARTVFSPYRKWRVTPAMGLQAATGLAA